MPAAATDIGHAIFESLASFRERLAARVREANAMAEKSVMAAAEEVNAIFAAASEQIARLRELLSGGDAGNTRDDLAALIDEELKIVGTFAAELNAEVAEQLRLTQSAAQSLSGISAAAAQVGNLGAHHPRGIHGSLRRPRRGRAHHRRDGANPGPRAAAPA